tara:strand:- start:1183 stop:1476 length:294 start_codon:yes stop_codon:yes gene_type:complete
MSEQEQKIIALIKSGMRAPEIAERLGCHPGTVYTTATRARLSTITGKTLDIEDKDKRIVQLYEQGLGPSIIMERMGVTKSAIRTAIARRNALRTGAA